MYSTLERLLYVTLLGELVALSDIKRIRKAVQYHRKQLKAFKRRFPKIWMQGAIEIELIDFAVLAASEDRIKFETIAAMLDYDPNMSLGLYPTLVLVHSHILVDIEQYEDVLVRDWFANEFSKAPRQAYCTRTRKDQTLDDMCWKIGSYPFKDRVQHNLTFTTDGYTKGSYFTDRQLSMLVMAYDSLCRNGFKNLLIGARPKGPRAIRSTNPRVPQAKMSAPEFK